MWLIGEPEIVKGAGRVTDSLATVACKGSANGEEWLIEVEVALTDTEVIVRACHITALSDLPRSLTAKAARFPFEPFKDVFNRSTEPGSTRPPGIADETNRQPGYDGPNMTQDEVVDFVRGLAGRPSLQDEQHLALAFVARQYVEALEEDPRRPLKVLERRLDVTRGQAKKRVHQAREAGVLGPTEHGRPGGEITLYGRRLLEAAR